MSLGTHISDGEYQVFRNFLLDSEIVLRRVLGAEIRLELSEQEYGTECRPIHRGSGLRSQDSVERIGSDGEIARASELAHEGRREQALRDQRTAAEGRFALELLEHQLLDRVVEDSKTSSNCHLAIFPGVPGNADSRCECFVIAGGQSLRNALVSWNHQAKGKHGR